MHWKSRVLAGLVSLTVAALAGVVAPTVAHAESGSLPGLAGLYAPVSTALQNAWQRNGVLTVTGRTPTHKTYVYTSVPFSGSTDTRVAVSLTLRTECTGNALVQTGTNVMPGGSTTLINRQLVTVPSGGSFSCAVTVFAQSIGAAQRINVGVGSIYTGLTLAAGNMHRQSADTEMKPTSTTVDSEAVPLTAMPSSPFKAYANLQYSVCKGGDPGCTSVSGSPATVASRLVVTQYNWNGTAHVRCSQTFGPLRSVSIANNIHHQPARYEDTVTPNTACNTNVYSVVVRSVLQPGSPAATLDGRSLSNVFLF